MRNSPARQIVRSLLFVALVAGLAPLAGPAIAADDVPPHVWVYSGTQNYRHASIDHAKEVIAQLAVDTGAFTVEFTEDPAELTAEMLARTDITLWLSPSGIKDDGEVVYFNYESAPFSTEQREAFVGWISCGGGFVGVHQAADSYDDWPEWDELVGAKFLLHPIWAGHPNAEVRVAAQAHVATAPWHGRASFELADEFYAWKPDQGPAEMTSDFQPLLRMTGYTDPLVAATWGATFEADQPLAWASTFRGKNRSFYTNLGHDLTTWDLPDFQGHLLGGIAWVAEHPVDRGCVAAS